MTIGSNRLSVLAAEIKDADSRVRRSAEQAAAAAIEAGHKLIEAKSLLPHGSWLAWLEDHASISNRTARRYMQIAGSGMEIGHVANLGIRGAAESSGKRRRAASTDQNVVVNEMFDLWQKMLVDFSHEPEKARNALKLRILEAMGDAEDGEQLMGAFLRAAKKVETNKDAF